MDSFEFPLAQKFAQRALELEPDNPKALETCGVLLLELGEQEKAKHVSFGKSDKWTLVQYKKYREWMGVANSSNAFQRDQVAKNLNVFIKL